jgi:putative cell wall-binding protein
MRIAPRFVALLCCAALVVGGAAPAWAAPTLTISLDPASPDGLAGWFNTPPTVAASVDETAVVAYSWSGGVEATALVRPGISLIVTSAPQGESTLTAVPTGEDLSVGATATAGVRTDSLPPSRPEALIAVGPTSPDVHLSWDAATDAVSGVASYIVYRNASGPPFLAGDAIAGTGDTTLTDTPPAGTTWYYAVAAADVAGNVSFLSDPIAVVPDPVAPPTPEAVGAWRNASGWVRVSWDRAVDEGSGTDAYRVTRTVGLTTDTVVATVPASAFYFDDHDPEALSGVVSYRVAAIDRAGLISTDSAPVLVDADLVPPAAPAAPAVYPRRTAEGAVCDVAWDLGFDAESGILLSEVRFSDGATTRQTRTELTDIVVRNAVPGLIASATVTVEDRAGNRSARSDVGAARAVSYARLAGTDRIGTALAISRDAFPNGSDTVVVVSSEAWPDALSAAALAGAVDGPVILAGPGPLPTATVAEIVRLGATRAWIVGGTGVVGADTAASLATAIGGTPTRIAGADRYATCLAVDDAVTAIAGTPSVRAYVASGATFADGMAAGPGAYREHAPVFLTRNGTLPAALAARIAARGTRQTVIVGGYGAVAASVDGAVPGSQRVAGADRYATARALAELLAGDGTLPVERPTVCTGQQFADGIAAASLVHRGGAPLLTTKPADAAALDAFLSTRRATVARVTIAGGESAVSEPVADAAWRVTLVP